MPANDAKEEVSPPLMAPMDRERMCNDSLNTSVMAALIGGFALGNLAPLKDDATNIDMMVYMLSYMTVHACTCSALTSAFIYAAINHMDDAQAIPWAKKNTFMLQVPMIKFVMGVMAYMVSVILQSWAHLDKHFFIQLVALIIGVMSVASVWVAYFMLQKSTGALKLSKVSSLAKSSKKSSSSKKAPGRNGSFRTHASNVDKKAGTTGTPAAGGGSML